MTSVLGRRAAPVLLGVVLVCCSFPYSASVLEDEHLEPLPRSNDTIEPSAVPVAETQQLLAELGYTVGPPDGLLGPRTRSAIAQFQRDYGLSANPPLLSEELLVQLRYVSCVRNGTADTVSINDCDTLLQADSIKDLARLPGSSDFIEASELVAVGLPIIMISGEPGDYGRIGYRGEESDEGGPAGSGDDVASQGSAGSAASSEPSGVESTEVSSPAGDNGSKSNKGGKGVKGGKKTG